MSNPVGVTSGRAGLVVVLSADAVRVACAERGWSLSELARRARISRPTLAAALRGQPVRARTAYKLAYALDQKPSTQLSQLLAVGGEDVDVKSPSVAGRGQTPPRAAARSRLSRCLARIHANSGNYPLAFQSRVA